VLVSGILIVAGRERVGRVDQVAVGVVDLQSVATRFVRGPDPLGTVIAVPQFRGDEDFLPRNRPRVERFTQRIAHRLFISVPLRAVEMSKAHFQRCHGGLLGRLEIRNQGAEPDDRDRTRSIRERNSRLTERFGRGHAQPSVNTRARVTMVR
jgi:hypothetical protein